MVRSEGETASFSESPNLPVSVKAALRCGDAWVLVRNDRGEWELPGGRIDPGDESLQAVVRRECLEELGVDVQVGSLIDSYLFEVIAGRRVVIVCFEATAPADATFVVSDEHDAVGLFAFSELADANLPDGYRAAISKAAGQR